MADNTLIPFTFDKTDIRVTDIKGTIWFVLKDVCNILGLTNAPETARNLDDDEKMTISNTDSHSKRGGARSYIVINESGFYSLCFRSRKEAAKRLKKWVTSEVLPSLRKNGSYTMPQTPKASPFAPPAVPRGTRIVADQNVFDANPHITLEEWRVRLDMFRAASRLTPKNYNAWVAAGLDANMPVQLDERSRLLYKSYETLMWFLDLPLYSNEEPGWNRTIRDQITRTMNSPHDHDEQSILADHGLKLHRNRRQKIMGVHLAYHGLDYENAFSFEAVERIKATEFQWALCRIEDTERGEMHDFHGRSCACVNIPTHLLDPELTWLDVMDKTTI